MKEGDTITISVALEKGLIEWNIVGENTKEYLKYETDKLKNKEIKWVPYLHMGDENDQVIWMD